MGFFDELDPKYNINGMQIGMGFKLQSSKPLDCRYVMPDIETRNALANTGAAYEGMEVFVESDKTTYKRLNDAWLPILNSDGTIPADRLGSVIPQNSKNVDYIVLKSSNGTLFKITIGDDGALITTTTTDESLIVNDAWILNSSVEGSTKKFAITADDEGILTVSEYTEEV